MQQPSILAIVVLYKMAPSESESVSTLLGVLDGDPELARHFSLTVYDNSPLLHPPESMPGIAVHYRHDPTNPGLATAYNYALDHAATNGYDWLLLLDQDTFVTAEFLAELITSISDVEGLPEIASIVPKLLVNHNICSPAARFIDQLRRPYDRSDHAVSKGQFGVHKGRLVAYNSGATLRASALRAIGGFPTDYWLDYLDHAVFHMLSKRGFYMYIMKAMLNHDPSQANIGTVPVWRQRNLLLAQTRFVTQTGNFFDRQLFRIYLLRYSWSLSRSYPDKTLWREVALQAISLHKIFRGRKFGATPTSPER